jgi:hypothetical protein
MVIEFLVLNAALLPVLKGEDSLWAVEVEEAVLDRFTAVLAVAGPALAVNTLAQLCNTFTNP